MDHSWFHAHVSRNIELCGNSVQGLLGNVNITSADFCSATSFARHLPRALPLSCATSFTRHLLRTPPLTHRLLRTPPPSRATSHLPCTPPSCAASRTPPPSH